MVLKSCVRVEGTKRVGEIVRPVRKRIATLKRPEITLTEIPAARTRDFEMISNHFMPTRGAAPLIRLKIRPFQKVPVPADAFLKLWFRFAGES